MRTATILLFLSLLILGACAPIRDGVEPATRLAVAASERHARTQLVLTREGPADGQARVYFQAQDAARITISFFVQSRARMRLAVTCDGRARRIDRPAGHLDTVSAWAGRGNPLRLELGPGERRRTLLELGTEVRDCDVTVTPNGARPYALRLLREDSALPDLAEIDAPLPACPEGRSADPLHRAFMGTGALSATCPMPAGPVTLLPDGIDALNARVEALTGRRVSRAALEAGDPDMALDWSAAPQLDLIYLTYLNVNADFAGYLTARMLAWHAARGTVVRILVSDVIQTDTDRRLFEGLAARYPTVQIQAFQFPASAADGLEAQLGRFHRVNHVKLFATLDRQTGRSVALVGGRNIHEGYFFNAPRDLSGWAFLHQYDPEASRLVGGFATYEDFEIALHGAAAERIVRHMASLWHRDHTRQVPRPPADAPRQAHAAEGYMRHFLSVPYADGGAQERYFADLFDAAQHSIHIAIPYLNLPPLLDAALRRARERGVSVRVATTVRVREATDFFVSGLNRQFINEFGDWLEFYDYDPYPRLLHSKLIVIDGRLAIITSTNLNQRSFVHDTENGVLILDRRIARQVDTIIQSYIARGERRRPVQPVSRLLQRLMRSPLIARAF